MVPGYRLILQASRIFSAHFPFNFQFIFSRGFNSFWADFILILGRTVFGKADTILHLTPKSRTKTGKLRKLANSSQGKILVAQKFC